MARMGSPRVQESAPLAPASKPTRRKRWLVLLVFAAVLLALIAGRRPVLVAMARFLDVSEPAQPTDYVMVLGGDMQIRPFVAAALLNAGLARKAVVAQIKPSG